MVMCEMGMILLGVLCGSLLFSRFLPMKLKGVDVTQVSADHNPGTANAMKYAGVPVGILCLTGDIFKGAVPVHIAVGMELMTGSLFPLVMAAPVFGHAYSLFHRGKGGKAIAVSFGVMIGLLPVQTEPLFILCALYLFFSLVMVIKPHTRRTRITFLLFALALIALACLKEVTQGIALGAVLISGIVIRKNSLVIQQLEDFNKANSVCQERKA